MRKLLLVDDSITIQKIVELTFTDEGFVVTTVGDGEQALERLAEEMPDIVLADVFMPGKSGYEVCERIKRDKRFQHIPVMLLVGSFEPYNEAEARRVGADDVLTKPFQSIRQLVNKVGALLGGGDSKHIEAETQNEERRDVAPASSIDAPMPSSSDAEPNADNMSSAYNYSPKSVSLSNIGEPLHEAAPEDSFSDPSLDDAMIEATPAEKFKHSDDDLGRDTMPLSRAEGREALSANADTKSFTESSSGESFDHQISGTTAAHDLGDETLLSMTPIEAPTPRAVEEEHEHTSMNDAEPFATLSHVTHANGADDALLDLGDLASPSAAAVEADDFILDLRDEFNYAPVANSSTEAAPPSTASAESFDAAHNAASEAATLVDFEEEITDAAPQATAYMEARNIGEAERANYAPIDEQFAEAAESNATPQTFLADAPQQTFDAATPYMEEAATSIAPGEVAVPQWDSANTHTSEDVPETATQIMTPQQSSELAVNQLSPEMIDQIARRVVEHISEKVLREIAWEVVPQLAELMIKRRLEEVKTQMP